MRVTIDFEDATGGRWAGSLSGGPDTPDPVRFDGRLQLLRLLEAMVDRASDHDGFGHDPGGSHT